MRWTVLVAALAAIPSSGFANPLDAFGFGARGTALGGAYTSLATDITASYYNPAGLADADGLLLQLGYGWFEPALEIEGADTEVDPSHGFHGGLVVPAEVLGKKLGVSLAVFLPDGLISRVRALPQSQPRYVLYDNRPQRLVISTSAGIEIVPDLHVGFGLTYMTNTRGTLDMNGVVNTPFAERTRLFTGVDVEFESVRYASAGVLYTPSSRWRFGAVFRDEFVLDLDLGARVRGDIALGEEELIAVEDGLFELRSINANLFSPRQVYVGASYAGDHFVASVDLGWLQWSRFPAPVSSIDVTLDLGDLDFAVPIPDSPIDPRFRDIVVPRAGLELVVHDGETVGVTARGGYFFEPSPAPRQPGPTNYIDSDKHGVTAGVGFELAVLESVLPRPISIDVALELIILPEKTYLKRDPADLVGDYRAGGTIAGGTVTTGLEF